MATPESFRRLEELTLNTAPAIHQAYYDGWVLRASGTDTRRANSITTLQESRLPLAEKIQFCEAWYRDYGQMPMFRLTEEFSPAELDAMLAARGYTQEVNTLVMTTSLADETACVDINLPTGAKLIERNLDDGLRDVHLLAHVKGDSHERDLRRQALWKGQQALVSLRTHNGLAATGMARIEDGNLGIFSMRTAERARGKGYASTLLAYLLTWGQAQGALNAFLQVDETNVNALALYRKFGFAQAYRYWHRVAPK